MFQKNKKFVKDSKKSNALLYTKKKQLDYCKVLDKRTSKFANSSTINISYDVCAASSLILGAKPFQPVIRR